ncbi:hemolysin III family protein [Salinimicrobium catena]|uniref:PAQR family membrane homeostasis protein TrhA n=1 Tax=Salinimicrobium catena TaxID=390640 RepID=UPI002FE4A6BA
MFLFLQQQNKTMEGEGPVKFYPPKEEKWNILTHGFGILLSLLAAVLLWIRAAEFQSTRVTLTFMVFAVSLLLLYASSTFYHSAKDPVWRFRLKVLDHIAIFILIAGTYTPFSLVTLKGTTGWVIFGVAWGIALTGTILKLFFTGKYKTLSTILYVSMGWIIIAAIKPLLENLSVGGLWWLFAGGLFYTLGAVLYSINRLKYNHALFHFFVLFGSFSHFMAIYEHVIPLKN